MRVTQAEHALPLGSSASVSGAVAAGPGSGQLAIAADQMRGITRELDQLSDAGLLT